MKFKLFSAILLTLLLSTIVCCTGPPGTNSNILSKLWNTEIGATPKAVVVKLNDRISTNWATYIEEAMQVRVCKLVVLYIESPGGSVDDTKLLTHTVEVLKEKYNVKIYVYSERLLASGAYWLATAVADNITVSPVITTGSIGVYMARLDMTALDSLWGLKYYYIRSGKNKTMGNSHLKPTQDEFMIYSRFVQKIYIDFLNVIWDSRADVLYRGYVYTYGAYLTSMPDSTSVKNYLVKLADGRIYDAEDAYNYGLVDTILYYDQYIEMLKKDYKVVNTDDKEL